MEKPNIVFILNDHQAYYGHEMQGRVGPKRPHFEKFAREGMEFTNSYCVAPLCGPARRSLLTGLYPHTHGQVHNENHQPYDHEVYLDTLAENGYENYYYGKWHAGPGCAYDHHCEGFSLPSYNNPYNTPEYAEYLKRKGLPHARHYVERAFWTDSYIEQNFFPNLKEGALYTCNDFWCGEHAVGITTTPKETHEAFFLANLACDKMEELAKREDGKPFTLRVDFWGPHQPFFPTQEFLDLYDPKEIAEYPSFSNPLLDKPNTLRMELNKPIGDGKRILHPNPLPWEDWQLILSRCYAHITMVDEAGSLIVAKLKALGLDENTLVIWTTDHGDSIACQGGHFDKNSHMAQEVMRIPLAMCWQDRIKPGGICDKLVYTNDLPVTILDAASLRFKRPVDGKSLLPVAMGKDVEWRDSLLLETYGHGFGVTIIGRMVVAGNIKYICNEKDLEELYDLAKDPYELCNLAVLPEYNELKEKMRELLVQKQKESGDPVSLERLLQKGE